MLLFAGWNEDDKGVYDMSVSIYIKFINLRTSYRLGLYQWLEREKFKFKTYI